MLHRVLPLVVAVLALGLMVSGPALAEELKAGTHEGKFVKADGDRFTMTGKDPKKEHSHDVARNAVITIDGKPAKLTDLQRGQEIKVTVEKQGDKLVVTKIEARKP